MPDRGATAPRWKAIATGSSICPVAQIPFWTSLRDTEERRFLELDEDRLGEADEAWIPVATSDGPGILVWRNSD